MIDLGTLEGLHGRHYELHAYCSPCRRWSALDLGQLVREGHGSRRLPLVVRCRQCGDRGSVQVRPPVPAWHGSQWLNP